VDGSNIELTDLGDGRVRIESTGGGGGGNATVWRNGSGAPSNSLGANGDYYLNDDNGDVHLKSSGTYSVVANIKGPQGIQGIQCVKGDTGDTGPQGPTGPSGTTGFSTVGLALGNLTDPSAIRFLRINADNTVTALTAADMRTAMNVIDTITLSGGNVGGTIAAGVTSYVSPTIDAIPSGTEANRASIVSVAGTLRSFYYSSISTQPATGTFVLTIRKATGMGAFSSTALTITVPAGAVAGIFSDTVNTVSVAAGDRLSIQIVNSATGASHSIGTWQMIIERTL
jgi:hypothetical protein